MGNASFDELASKLRPLLEKWVTILPGGFDIVLQCTIDRYGEEDARRKCVEHFRDRWVLDWLRVSAGIGWPSLITDRDFACAMGEYVLGDHRVGEPLNVERLLRRIVQRVQNAEESSVKLAEVGAEGSPLDASLRRDIIDRSIVGSIVGGTVKIRIDSDDIESPGEANRHVILLKTTGLGSSAAHKETTEELAFVARSILRTFQLVELVDCEGVELGSFADQLNAPNAIIDLTGLSENSEGHFLSLPLVLRHFKWLFDSFLDDRTSNEQRKGGLAKRISTACSYLCEADRTTVAPMRAVATFAAIEALVGRKGEQTTENIARRVMCLVEPRRENRHNVKRVFKRLYDLRCDIVHGNSFEADGDVVTRSRLLAAVLLFAVLERNDMARRLQDQLNEKDFLKEVDEAADTGQEIPTGLGAAYRREDVQDAFWRLLRDQS
jgi:hypothetical protein